MFGCKLCRWYSRPTGDKVAFDEVSELRRYTLRARILYIGQVHLHELLSELLYVGTQLKDFDEHFGVIRSRFGNLYLKCENIF